MLRAAWERYNLNLFRVAADAYGTLMDAYDSTERPRATMPDYIISATGAFLAAPDMECCGQERNVTE